DVAVPVLHGEPGVSPELAAEVLRQADRLMAIPPHLTRHDIDVSGLRAALAAVPVPLSTMGRDLGPDPAAFLAAAAAGRHAAHLLAASASSGRPRRGA